MGRRRELLAVFCLAGLLLPSVAAASEPADPMLDGDPVDASTGLAAEIMPGVPWTKAGPDGVLGTSDDEVRYFTFGDVDIVVRAGDIAWTGAMPLPAPYDPERAGLVGVAEPFDQGVSIPFSVIPTDGSFFDPAPVEPDYLRGMPFLVLAFADLDGDGFVGVTDADGDADAAIEAAELEPVGAVYAIGREGRAQGTIAVGVGAPGGASVALTAIGLAGGYDDEDVGCWSCHGWKGPASHIDAGPLDIEGADILPRGPAVMTHLPFQPDPDLASLWRTTPREPLPATPAGRPALEVRPAWTPDPSTSMWDGLFALWLDGGATSIDVVRVYGGALSRFGASVRARTADWSATAGDRIRPGVDADGRTVPLAIVQSLSFASGEERAVTVVPLDRLGNVTDFDGPADVTLRTTGAVTIASPDADGDPAVEVVSVPDPRGVVVTLAGPTLDEGETVTDRLLIEGGGGLARVDLTVEGAESPTGGGYWWGWFFGSSSGF
jgi:hypothetical protein